MPDYSASSVKRARRTKAQVEALRAAICEITEAAQPCSVRHVYYLGVGVLWGKDTGASRRHYSVVVRELGLLRESGRLPWEWITDGTRMVRQETQYDSLDDAMRRNTESYRRNLWASQRRRVEVWCESDSVGGVLQPITRAWGVGLFSCRGQSSKTFVHEAAQEYARQAKPVTVIYVGDWDPTGRCVPRSVVERMDRYGDGTLDLDFRQIAITAHDVRAGQLTSHQVNVRDVNYARYREECLREGIAPDTAVEVEALSPGLLRQRLDQQIEGLVDDVHQWNVLARAEEADRALLRALQGAVRDARRPTGGQ
ncbi:hypothetical protein [Streptacidiphilus jiangxiensis]|uniref:DUF2399 domain-containing protein n=1 Tax=Streptacidiphilus jiangxiensis TaxID=235985 RepID=A0A1H8B0K7_STRJI|nr:hypothetical protein [Streptacidiphilus jiangxiensis]SEM76502.1 hypothetical protein SAMN05414137_1552 [Streptacidiphilus jiangxiensis]